MFCLTAGYGKRRDKSSRSSFRGKSRWGDMSSFWVDSRDGKILHGSSLTESLMWKPDLAAVKATIEHPIKIGRSRPREYFFRHRGKCR